MDERDFVNRKRTAWDQLAALVERANGRRGLRTLDRDEVRSLGPLYRRVSSDLAYARAHAVSADLVVHLNRLVGSAHALLYEAEASANPYRSVLNFYIYDFPSVLQKHVRYFAAAVGISVFGAVLAYWLVIRNPENLWLFVPPGFEESVKYWKSGHVAAEASAPFAGMLMTHNFQVGLIALASGILGGVPTAYMMLGNGTMLGAMAALMTQVHKHGTFWPGVVPHGIAELTALFICGAAGFLLGKALLSPGRYDRADALRIAAKDAGILALGTIPLFIFAGITEAMFSRLATPPSFRYSYAATNGVIWYCYLFIPRRKADDEVESQASRNSLTR